MNKIAVYPGSFDPITLGHVDIIQRLSAVFEKVIVLVAKSSTKDSLFTPEERKDLILKTLKHVKNVEVDIYEGLTVDYLKSKKIHVIVRGLRAVVDFEYEMTMASMNKKLQPEIETLLMFAAPEFYYISSRGVKEVAAHGGPLEGLVPSLVMQPLVDRLTKK